MFQVRKGPYCPANEWVHCQYISCKEVCCFVLFFHEKHFKGVKINNEFIVLFYFLSLSGVSSCSKPNAKHFRVPRVAATFAAGHTSPQMDPKGGGTF